MIHRTRAFHTVICGQIILCSNEVNKSFLFAYIILKFNSILSESFYFFTDTNNRIGTVKFLDYQLMAYDSFANDLVFFLFSSVNDTVRKTHIEHFFKHYHEHLYKTLKLLQCPLGDYTYEKYALKHIPHSKKGSEKFLLCNKWFKFLFLDAAWKLRKGPNMN